MARMKINILIQLLGITLALVLVTVSLFHVTAPQTSCDCEKRRASRAQAPPSILGPSTKKVSTTQASPVTCKPHRSQAATDSNQCASGYIADFPPICGNDGCLPVIKAPKVLPFIEPMDSLYRGTVAATQGWLSMNNIDLIYHVTRAQRDFRIYGSVGEIGVYFGRFTGVLAFWLDKAAGERLFVCDIFDKKLPRDFKTEVASLSFFEATMLRFGYSVNSKEEATLIRTWNDSSIHLSKSYFLKLGLPAFRIFSIDGNHNKPFPLLDLRLVSCILHEGGVVAMDDFGNTLWPDVGWSVRMFNKLFGKEHLWPFVLLGNKLYLVTRTWHRRYVDWFEKHEIPSSLHLKRYVDETMSENVTFYSDF